MSDRLPSDGGQSSLSEILSAQMATTPAAAVARWWGRALLMPAFRNGEADLNSLNLTLQQLRKHNQHQAAIEAGIARFVTSLETRINDLEGRNVDRPFDLNVQYDPDEDLRVAAREAGIDQEAVWPWKSYTCMKGDRVLARLGADGKEEQIWPPEEAAE